MRRSFATFISVPVLLTIGAFVPFAHAASVYVTNVSPASGISAGDKVTFYASAVGFANPKYSVTDSTGTNGTIDNYGYFSWTPTVDDAGSHTFTVSITGDNGTAASTTVSIYVIADALSLSSFPSDGIAYTGAPVTFTVTAPGFESPTYTVSDRYAGTSLSSNNITSAGAFSWTPNYNEQGIHTLTITAQDLYGRNASITKQLTVVPPTVAIGTVSPSTSVTPGTATSFTATEVGLTSPTYSVEDSLGRYSTVSASSLASTTGTFSWTPSATDLGTHVLTVTAKDVNGSTASAKVTLTVSNSVSTATTPAPTQTSSVSPSSSPTSSPSTATPTPAASTVATDGYVFTSYLGMGSRGTAVTELQKRLTALGAYTGPVTGYFGPMTEGGVQTFQRVSGIVSSGTPWTTGYGAVGPKTRAALNAS